MFRNTLAQSLAFTTQTLFSLLLAPIMLHRFGLTLYGVWTVVGAIVTYAGLLDAGIARSLSRFIALYDARSEPHAIQRCIGLGLLAVTAVGSVMMPLAWVAAPILHAALGHLSVHDMRLVLLASTAIFVAHGYVGVLAALPEGLRRMLPPNVALSIGSAVNFAVSVGVLLASRSLVVYAWANAAAEALTIVLVLISVRRVWGRRRLVAMPTWALTREILGYSVSMQLVWLAALITTTTDRIVIGIMVGASAAGAYALAASVALGLRSLGILTISAMIPTATAEIVHGAKAAVATFFRRYAPVSSGLSIPVFALGALTAPFLLKAWLGEHTKDATAILIVLCFGYTANVLTGVATTLAMADGRPAFVSRNAIAGAALNLVLAVALAPLLGLWGVMAATVISIVALSATLLVRFFSDYGLLAADAVRAFVIPSSLSCALLVPLVPIVIATAPLATSRLSAAALLAAVTAAYAIPYWLLAGRAGLLPERIRLAALRSRATA